MINEKSKYYDSTFPRPVRLSESRVGWSAYEIHQWIKITWRVVNRWGLRLPYFFDFITNFQ